MWFDQPTHTYIFLLWLLTKDGESALIPGHVIEGQLLTKLRLQEARRLLHQYVVDIISLLYE